MNRSFRCGGLLGALLVMIAFATRCSAQALPSLPGVHDSMYCASTSQGSMTQTGGANITSFGTIHSVVIFIDFSDDSTDVSNSTWPVGIGPSYLSDIIDLDTSVHSNKQYNITTYFDRMSFNNLHVVGHPYYKQALHTLAWYKSQPAFKSNIEYWATRHVLEYIDTAAAYNVNYALFDRWTENAPYSHTNVSDGSVDQIFVMWRRWYKDTASNGFVAEGWVPLVGSSFAVEGGTRTIDGYHVTNSTGLLYYPITFDSPIHEFGHYLGLPHQYDGGLWSVMGQRNSNVSYCMNSFEREQMGWITFTDITVDGTTASIPDFASTGTAYRVSVPGSKTKFLIENHQGTEMYDVVDYSTTAPGLYILRLTDEVYDNGLQLMNSDGRWHWNNPDSVVNPWGSTYIPMFQRDTVMRDDGLTHREHIPYSKPRDSSFINPNPTYFMYVWLDERSGDTMIGPRKFGDGNDRWNTDVTNMFSPWSNPSSASGDTASSHIGVEVTGTSGSNINVKFYITHPENGPPSRPQDLRCWAYVDTTGSYPHLTWNASIEPDLAGYEIWRRIEPMQVITGATWQLIDSVGPGATSYVDMAVDSADTVWAMNSVSYRIRAFDSSDKLSTYSEERGIYWGRNDHTPPGGGGGGCCEGGGKMVARRAEQGVSSEVALWPNRPNPFSDRTEIAYSLTRAGRVIVDVFDASGTRVAVLVDDREQGAGSYRTEFDGSTLPAGVYLCRVLVNGMAVAEPITIAR